MEENSKNTKNSNVNNKQNNSESAQNAGFFQLTKSQISHNISKYESVISVNNMIFQSKLAEPQNSPIVFKKRLNSLDSTMLEGAAYNVLDNNELKLEKRIEKVKNNIAEIDEKIVVAQTVKDISALEELNLQKRIAIQNLNSLMVEYKTYKSVPSFVSVFSKILNSPKNISKFVAKNILYFIKTSALFKHIKPLMRSFMVRDTIIKLKKINKSVDELVKMQIPFGEQDARYATLVNQLASAGALHTQILKEFDNY